MDAFRLGGEVFGRINLLESLARVDHRHLAIEPRVYSVDPPPYTTTQSRSGSRPCHQTDTNAAPPSTAANTRSVTIGPRRARAELRTLMRQF